MPDISMCLKRECPKAETCYRFRAEPNPYRQAYADFRPLNEHGCSSYYPIAELGGYRLQPFEKGSNENHRG